MQCRRLVVESPLDTINVWLQKYWALLSAPHLGHKMK